MPSMDLSAIVAVLIILALITVLVLLLLLLQRNTGAFTDELNREDVPPSTETKSADTVVIYTYNGKNAGKRCAYCDCENNEAAVFCQVCGQAFPTKGA